MALNGLTSPQTRSISITPRQSSASQEEWKQFLQEVKLLYLRRRYKQCAARATDLLRQSEGQLHALHESYLHYYAAASYETLGHIAHNFSTNKLPLLYMAKDCYASCNACLDTAFGEFEDEQDKLNFPVDEDDDNVSQATCLHYQLELNDAAMYPGNPWDTADSSFQEAEYGDQTAFHSSNEESNHLFRDASSCYSSERDDGNDRIQTSDSAKLMPSPLCIRKPHPQDQPLPDSPKLKLYRRSYRPLPEPPVRAPFHPENSLKPEPKTAAHRIANHARSTMTSPVITDTAYSHRTRLTTQITSLSTQLTANIEAVTTLIENTAELQRIHKASRNHRLASFWSFTPFQTPSAFNNTSRKSSGSSSSNSKPISVSGTSTGSSQTSNSTTRAAIDDSKKQRIERLRADQWRTVGIRAPEREWKGAGHYERLCGIAMAELYGY